MDKRILICAIIALVLVPATVMAAGSGENTTSTAPGNSGCLHDGQNCMNDSGQQGSGAREQYRHGMQQNGARGAAGSHCSGDGQCTGEQKQTRSMLRLHEGTGTGIKVP